MFVISVIHIMYIHLTVIITIAMSVCIQSEAEFENLHGWLSYSYQDLSIAQLHQYIMDTWQEHCLSKRVEKDFKRHQDMFTPSFCKNVAQMPDWGCGAHNRGHLQSSCTCSSKKKPKGFHTSAPRYHYPEKPLQFSRKPKYKPRLSGPPKQYKPKRFIKRRSS